jgi:hypothetical protein
MNNLSNMDIRSIELNISYDPAVLTATGISLTGTVLENENYLYEYNTDFSGIIYTAFASNASHFTGTGLCLNLDFTVIGAPNDTSDILISTAFVNNQSVSISNGFFTVAPDDPPMFTGIIPHTMNEDESLVTSLTINDNESNPCDLTLAIISSNETLVPANTISYTCMSDNYYFSITPVTDQFGLVTITIVAGDSGGLTASASFDLTVVSVNDAPVLANPISNRIATEGTAYAYTIPSNTFTDVDPGDVLTYTATQFNGNALPEWLSFDPSTRTFSGTPSNSDLGAITITITVTDGSAQSITDTFVLNVNNTNTAPVLDNPIADQTIDENIFYSFTFAADTFHDNDVAFGDKLSYTAMLADSRPLPSWLTFDMNNRHFSGTPTNDDVGMYTITVIAKDTLNLSAMDSFYLTVISVNSPPVLGIITDQITNEDTPIQFSFTAEDNETEDCNRLNVNIESSDISLIPNENISYTCSGGSMYISVTPVSNVSGLLSLTITISDPLNLSAVSTVDLTITSVNDSPVISSISDQSTSEDTAFAPISITITDIEDTSCSMDIIITSSDTSIIPDENISYTCNASTYTLAITPAANQNGLVTLSLTVTDSGALVACRSFDLTVTAVNDPPMISSLINSQSLNEGESIDITLTASDTEGDSLSLTVVSANQSLIQDNNFEISNNGSTYTITITPLENQSGTTDITISVSDGTDMTHMTFSITVNEVYYIIAGHVSSYTDIVGSDLQGVTMTLAGTYSYSMVTNADGYYTFTTVRPGDYTLTASKSDQFSLEIADAIKILNASVRLISLTCLEQIAADAYIDGRYGAYDAAWVASYVAGVNHCLNDSCTFWQFVTENITSCETWPLIEFESTRRYTDLTGDTINQNFIGIGCGNVSE